MLRVILVLPLLFTVFKAWANIGNMTADIRAQFRPDEYETVLVGETDVPVFVGEPTTALSRGVAIIIVDNGYQGLTLGASLSLASQLQRWGWNTLIAPALIAEKSLDKLNTDTSSELTSDLSVALHRRSSNATQWLDHKASLAQMNLLVNALYQHAEGTPGFRLLISQGMSAAQILELSAKDTIPSPDSLVMVSPFWPDAKPNNQLVEHLAGTLFPVLDLQLQPESHWTHNNLPKRHQATTESLKLHYRQKALSVSSWSDGADAFSAPFSNTISREIYGWVNHLGW